MKRYLGTTGLGLVLGVTMGVAACGGGDDDTSAPPAASGGSAGSSGSGTGGAGKAGANQAGAGTGGTAQGGAGSGGAGAGGAGAGGAGMAGAGGTGPVAVLPGPSRGSAVALSPDDSTAVVANRDTGTVTVVAIDYSSTPPKLTKTAEIDVGAGSEPWQVAYHPGGGEAYVVLRKAQKLVKISGLPAAPKKDGEVSVGSEPTGLAVTPTGSRVWVANWVDGTVQGVDPAKMEAKPPIDLNDALVKTGLLGSITARPGLAHPRSVAITNNGDQSDDDETMLVTEYFAQRTKPEGANGADADTAKKGLVYAIKLADKSVTTIDLAPLDDIGFKDHKGGTAGCFPNQVQGVTINKGQAFVVSVCASPKGPIGPFTGPAGAACDVDGDCPGAVAGSCVGADAATMKKGVCSTNCTMDTECGANGGKCNTTTNKCDVNAASVKTATSPVMHVIDLATSKQIGAQNLAKSFSDKFDALATPDDNSRRLPHLADDIAFVPGTNVSYLSANGADAVFRAKYKDDGSIEEVGSTTAPFINLAPSGITPAEAAGRGPVGVVVTHQDHNGQKYLFSANDITRNLSMVDLNAQGVLGGASAPVVASTAPMPAAGSPEAAVLRGKRFFNTGLARWSLKGQGWGSCQACHVDGLTDNVTWYFARGPRQSTSLDATYSKGGERRIMNWTAIFDEVSDFEGNTRGVSGGVGAIVTDDTAPISAAQRIDLAAVDVGGAKQSHAGLSGSAAKVADPANPLGIDKASKLADWAEITEYVRQLRAPRKPSNLDAAAVTAGAALFGGANCQGCHGGENWTISKVFYDPTLATTNALKTKSWAPPAGFPAALLPASTPANQLMRFGGANPAALDQLQCILRPVGTFGTSEAEVSVAEVRADMSTKAQGDEADGKGYNPPSLLGLATGAPYFHAGNARTLEGLFSSTFATHMKALSPNFLDDDASGAKKAQLIQFLLSIDEDTTTVATPASPGSSGGNFCAAP